MHTSSNPTWKPGDRPSLHITPAGRAALAYFEYIDAKHIVSLMPSDRAAPPEQYDDDRQPDLDVTGDDDDRCPFCGADLDDAFVISEGIECSTCGEILPDDYDYGAHSPEAD